MYKLCVCLGKKYAELHGGAGGDKKKDAKAAKPKKEQPPKQEKKQEKVTQGQTVTKLGTCQTSTNG